MENYGNDLFLSQEGCPSLDFTLLDRPSSSTVSAPGATAPLLPGENTFPSFDIFDGAGVESFDDHSFPGHRSYVSDVQKDAMRRNASNHPGPVQRQMHGVHDFFGQDNQQQHLGPGSWPGMGSGGSHIQSQYFLSGFGNAGDSNTGNMPMKDALWGNTQSSSSGMPTGDGGFLSVQSSKPINDNRISNEAVVTSVANQIRNQLGSALKRPSDSQDFCAKFGKPLPINNGAIEHQLAANDTAIQNTPFQNQYGMYASQTPMGAAVNEAPRLNTLANQIPWKTPAQATHDPQARGPIRGGGMTELQLLRQQALQSKHEQAIQSKQQQTLRLQQQESLRLQKQEAMRAQQHGALQMQQQEAVRVQQQDAVRLQQEVMSMQRQEGMQRELTRVQQQETLRLQQQEGLRLKQQEAMRMQEQEVTQLRQHNSLRSPQEGPMQSQQREEMWLRQHDTVQSQQQDGTRPQCQDVMRSQQQDATHWQHHEVTRSQQQPLWSSKQQWSQHGGVLESLQKQNMQSQQQKPWQPQQLQVLPSQQRQTLQLALQSQQHRAWQTQQQQALYSQQQQASHPPQQQQALRMQQQALWAQQQQAFQSHQQRPLQTQQQQATPFQQHPPLQTQNQLQEFFVGQQLNHQLEQPRPQFTSQEACTEFPGTSYSALLHGPDTPPSQPQVGEEPALSELEDHTGAFPSTNTQNFVWPIDGSSYYQGSSHDPSTVQNLVEQHNLHSGSSPAEVAHHSQADGSFPLVKNVETQSSLPDYERVGLLSPSIGKPMFQADKPNESRNEPRNRYQVNMKPLAQSSHYGLDNGRNPMNLLSQSQQHFQELQLSQQRSWESLAQKQGASKPSFSEANYALSQSILTPEKSTSQSEIQQNLSASGPRSGSPGNDSYLLGRTQIDSVASYYSHQISDAKHEIWGNKAAQQVTRMVQNSFSSDSPQVVSNNNQNTPLDVRVPLMKMGGRSSLSNQEISKLNQVGGWKESDRATVSEQSTLSLSESDQLSYGYWKRHASLQDSVGGLHTMCEPLKKVGSGSIWNHSLQREKLALEGRLDVQTASGILNSMSGHAEAGQGTHETQYLEQEGASQKLQKHVGGQNFTDSVDVISGGTATTVFKDTDTGQICSSKMSVQPQGSLVDEQRASQQHMDPNATNVSLAHLRQSRPSSPLSPQHVKLGLGPSSLSQNLQQVGTAGMRMSPLRDGLVRKGPTSNVEIRKFPASPLYSVSAGVQLNGTLLQNNGRPSSALSNSSSFSRESVESETLGPSVFASAQLERPKVSQGNVNSGVNSLCGVEHLQTSASSLEEESSASLNAKVTTVSESSKQPSHSAGNSEDKLSTVYRQANNDTSSLRVLQNQQILNMALKQLGNKGQAANLAGLLTTLKTSLSENSKTGGREKFFPGIVEPDHPPSSSIQEGGYAGGNATQSMQRPQMVSRKLITGNDDCSPSKLRAGSQSVLVELNNHLIVNQEKSHTFEASGSASTSLLADLQRQRGQSLSLMNGDRSQLLHSGGQCENEGEFTGSKTSNLAPSPADSQMRGPEASFAFSGQSQYLQQQRNMIEVSSYNQTFKEPIPGAVWTATLPNSAVKAVGKSNEAVMKSSDSPPIHGYLPKVSLGQQDGVVLTAKQKFKSLREFKEMLQQNASGSEYINQRGLQWINASTSGHGQLPKQVVKSVLNAISSVHTDKGADSALDNDVEALDKMRLNSGDSNNWVLPSQELRHDDSRDHRRLITSSQISLADKQAQAIASGDRDAHVSPGSKDPAFKVEEARPGIKGDVAALNQSPEHQVSPSKTSSHGVLAVHPKKRKKPVPLLIPWHVAVAQPRNSLPSSSEAELMWANTANRLPDKDDGDVHKGNLSSGFRAKRRLKLTTHLMQQLIPPLSSRLMHGNSLVDNECATYSLAKLGLEDACRLVVNTQREASSAKDSSENKNMPLHGPQGRTWGMAKNIAVVRCVESFVERAKRLDGELARIDSSSSASEVGGKINDLEKMAIVNRLARHHGTGFTVDSSEICSVGNVPDVGAGIWKPSPKKYVTAAPMPRTLPGVKCLSL